MGLSSSKTKTKSSSSSTPLDQYAPYITQGLTSAQGVFDANQANLARMSQNAYGLYDNLASSIGSSAGTIGDAQRTAASIYGGTYLGTNPGASTYSALQHATDPSMGLLSQLAQGSTSPGHFDAIGASNPALASLQGMTSQHNPALDLLSGMANPTLNPDSASFYQDTLGGKYLNANPYLDAITTQATDAATKAANRRFAAAGMDAGMATPYAQALGQSVADANNRTRYQAYNDELARMGQIGSQSDSQYNAAHDRALAAATSMGGLYASDADRALSAATGLGNLSNQTGQLRLSAEQARNDAFDRDRAAQLAGTQALGQQQTADNRVALDAASGADTQHSQQIAQQLQALELVPGLAQAQYAGVSPALAALQAAAGIPYTGVNNYADLVNGLTGKYGNQISETTTKQTANIGELLLNTFQSSLNKMITG